jgi:hypothetical protein
MDLAQFTKSYAEANEKGRVVSIINPDNGEPTGIYVTIAGPYSQRQEKASRDLSQWLAENPQADEPSRRAAVARRHARGLVSWSWGDNTYNGSVPEFTVENIEKLLLDCKWFYDQIAGASLDQRGFLSGSV